MKPLSDFTTPRRLIWPISRHFFPVEHPEPFVCCTTGLKKGSRFPIMAHFFASGLGGLGASTGLMASAVLLMTVNFSLAAILVLAILVVAGTVTGLLAALGASIFATATFAAGADFWGATGS